MENEMKTYMVVYTDGRPDREISAGWLEIRGNGDLLFLKSKIGGEIEAIVQGGTYESVEMKKDNPQFLQE